MEITEKEFEAIEDGLSVALGEGMLNENVAPSCF